ncbi:basic leucine zipper 23-like [Bidens hawaiensis]|uniref:basic leucine zipper 23-like n=1 Tax=Bidens hawaiensis TaxID=980011 RepID=UPI00404A4B8A
MDNGELDEMFLGSNLGSMNSLFDEIFNDTHACTHTHKCNPPGPDSSHTHTCYHMHTKILPALSNDENTPTDDTAEFLLKKPKKRPSGNREAVRKYREKKKARAASLEDEVVRLRALNQQLMKRVQSQMGLEAEVGRLKCLLVDIRGRIDGEIRSFPYQKQNMVNQSVGNPNLAGGFLLNPCNMQRGALMDHGLDVNECGSKDLQCLWNQDSMVSEIARCGGDDGVGVGANSSTKTKRKGVRAATSK